MQLSKQTLPQLKPSTSVSLPDVELLDLPEKVLQFGTGVFIRGLIDYFFDKANREGHFSGRAVVVKSTNAGDTDAFSKQDGLYTLIMKSVENGNDIEEKVVCAAVSRVLTASEQWNEVLECASNPELSIIVSNTTETGIVLAEGDSIHAQPPASFPAKLLAFLYKRYQVFNGDKEKGFVIVPTELIPGNGDKLKNIVNQLAIENKLEKEFIQWMNDANDFCNSLVDRIVPGKLPEAEQKSREAELGYTDELMIMAETFGLWAIETHMPKSASVLSFSKAHPGIHIVEDIEKFRELKLRLLNGSHNLSCAVGFLAGFNTVIEAMQNEVFDKYMQRLILKDIAASILSNKISEEDARAFGTQVLERYRNPYVEFQWLSICVQDTSKIKIRAVPIIEQHQKKYGFVPDGISLGMAAYILFMKSELSADGRFYGTRNGERYAISDDFAANLHDKWKQYEGVELVQQVLGDESLWETNLSAFPNFADKVWFYLNNLMQKGFFETVKLKFKEAQLSSQ